MPLTSRSSHDAQDLSGTNGLREHPIWPRRSCGVSQSCAINRNGPGSVWKDSSPPGDQWAAETLAVLSLGA